MLDQRRHLIPLACVPVIMLLLSGCGGEKTASITGNVTYKGKAVTGGTIVFATEDLSKFKNGVIDEQGNYKAEVPYGKLKVGVEPVGKPPESFMPMKGKKSMPENAPNYGTKQAGTYVDIPVEKRSPEKSNITVTIDGTTSTHNIDLDK